MTSKYLTIGVRGITVKELEKATLESGILNWIVSIKRDIKADVVFEDKSQEIAYANDFLRQNNLEDENPFFNDFQIEPYSSQIDFELPSKSKDFDILEPVIFILAQHLSIILKAECIVMFENMRMPVGLFDNGSLKQTFEKYNAGFFSSRAWKPNSFFIEK